MKKIIILSLILLSALTAYYFGQKKQTVSSEEFFNQNKHLERKMIKSVEFEQNAPRTSGEFVTGDYKFTQNSFYKINFKSGFGIEIGSGTKKLSQTMDGDLKVFSYGFQSGYVALHVMPQFSSLVSNPDALVDAATKKTVLKKDKEGLLFIIEPKGKVIEAFSTNDYSESKIGFTFNLIDQTLRPIPAEFEKTGTFTVTEKDDRGQPYNVNYTIGQNGDFADIKASYESISSMGGPSRTASAGVGPLADLALKSTNRQQAATKWNKVVALPQAQTLELLAQIESSGTVTDKQESKSEFGWVKIDEDPALPEFSALKKKLPKRWSLMELKSISVIKPKGDSKKSEKDTKSILKDLDKVSGMGASETEKTFLDLAQNLEKNPELIDDYKNRFLSLNSGDRARNMILGAFGYEGSIQSQAAMVEIYNNPATVEDEKIKVLNELAISPYALSAASKQFLTNEYKTSKNVDLSTSSILALGSSISKDGDPSTVDFISKEWKKAKSTSDAEQGRKEEILLLSMGNSKSNAFDKQIDDALESDSKVIQENAVNALRFNQNEDSREKLYSNLTENDFTDVRIVAAQSMRYQPKDDKTLEALKSCTSDPEVGVRVECYRSLSALGSDEKIKSMLESAVGQEQDEQAKEVLKNILSSF